MNFDINILKALKKAGAKATKEKTDNTENMKGNFNSVINDAHPVIVDFHALWCGPCKMQSPILKEVADELGDKIRVIKIDVDQNPELAERYNVQSVPTLMIFKDGEVRYRQSGVHTKSQLMNVLIKNI